MANRTSTNGSSDASKVKSANNAYYKALSARDMSAMERVWTGASNNILIAPPTNPTTHVGWEAIKRNWENYWPTFSQFSVSMVVVGVNVNGPIAWVHGIETSRRRSKLGEVTSSRNYGTNIFVNYDGVWLLEFHQSALILESQERTLTKNCRTPRAAAARETNFV
jgi:hypothetical protein